MSELKEITRKKKNTKFDGNPWASSFRPIHHWRTSIKYLKTFLHPMIWWTLCLPHFAKRSNEFCCKRSHYVKDAIISDNFISWTIETIKIRRKAVPKQNKIRGVSQYGLAIYIKKYLKAKEELWKLKYFTMQKYNLQKILWNKPKSFNIII